MPGSPSQVGGGGAAGSLDAWVLWVGGEVPQIPASPPPSPRPLGSPPIGIEASPDAWVPPSGHLGAPPGHLGVPPGHLGAPHPGHPGPTHLRQPGGATSSPVALVYHGTNWGVGRGSWNNRDPTITHPHTPPPAAAALDAWVVPPPPRQLWMESDAWVPFVGRGAMGQMGWGVPRYLGPLTCCESVCPPCPAIPSPESWDQVVRWPGTPCATHAAGTGGLGHPGTSFPWALPTGPRTRPPPRAPRWAPRFPGRSVRLHQFQPSGITTRPCRRGTGRLGTSLGPPEEGVGIFPEMP